MISRRLLITGFAAAAASAIAPAVMAAGDGGFGDLLGGLADAASRRYAEKYRDDARWDGKYYYDKYDNRRYSRSEWQREIQRRARAEEEGRDWRDSKRRAWEENVTARTIASSRKNSVVMKKIAARMTVAMPKNAVKTTAATPENVVAMNGIAETTIVAVTTANPLLYG